MAENGFYLKSFDLQFFESTEILVGVDEAGRGAFAGPVVAAALSLRKEFYVNESIAKELEKINDSKKLDASTREVLFSQIKEWKNSGLLNFSVGEASVEEIEAHNVVGATKKAMQRALVGLSLPLGIQKDAGMPLFYSNDTSAEVKVLIDGPVLKNFEFAHQGVIKGDGKSLVIAMASIVAKVTRDHFLIELDKEYPQYQFAKHKGYGTPTHQRVILEEGPLPIHRPRFLRKLFAAHDAAKTN